MATALTALDRITSLRAAALPLLDPPLAVRFRGFDGFDPASFGFVRSRGWPRGQLEDWRMPLPDGSGLHLQRFHAYWELHRDRSDPSNGTRRHVLLDMPVTSLVIGVAIGAVVGERYGRQRQGAVAGGVAALVMIGREWLRG